MGKTKAFKVNDAGISMVELIVVIAIVGLLAGGTLISTKIIPVYRLNACVKEAASSLEKTRTDGLSYRGATFTLEVKDDGVYVTRKVNRTGSLDSGISEKIGDKDIAVFYELNETIKTQLTIGKSIEISFDRSSGALKAPVIPGRVVGANEYCNALIFNNGTVERTIELIQLTGKIVLQ